MVSHDGFSTQYESSSHTAVVKLRDGYYYVDFNNNQCWLVVDTFDANNSDGYLYDGDTVAYLNSGSVLTLQENTFNDPEITPEHPTGTYNWPLPWHVKIHNNIFGVIYRSNNTTGDYRHTSLYAFDTQLMNDTTTEIYGNTCYYVNSYATYGHPGFDGSGAFCRIRDDTLHKIDTTVNGTTITNTADTLLVLNDYADSANYNTMTDIYWASGGTNGIENDVYFTIDANDCDITWKRTLSILVTDGDDTPLSGATVTVTDNYGNVQIDTTTNGSGVASGVVNYYYMSSDIADSTHSPFILYASYGGSDETVGNFNVNYATYSDTLVIGEATAPTYHIRLNSGNINSGVFK